MRTIPTRVLIVSFLLLAVFAHAQVADSTLQTTTDSIAHDSLQVVHVNKSADTLDAPVKYSARDSIWYDLKNQLVYLLGDAKVEYKDITLEADSIIFDWANTTVYAEGRKDSSGKIIGKPVFTEGDNTYNAEQMAYNFKTKKGKINDVVTQENEGRIISEQVKRMPDEVLFAKDNKYTTCDEDPPHFYIYSSKIKVIPGKAIVSGPANLVIEGVPTPLFVPFGIFPISTGRKSGIIFPQYGVRSDLGYYLQQGGYYFGLNDHFDLALTGDIYSRGSWLLNASTRYAKRYKYNGNLGFRYATTRLFDSYSDTYSPRRDFDFNWSFNQDGKARPNSRFSSNVRFGTSKFNQTYSNVQNYLDNSYNSSISYYQSIPHSPFNFSANLDHSQSTLSHTVSLDLPTFTFNMNRVNPFKKKVSLGEQKWYEKIGLSYTMNAINRVSTLDSLVFSPTVFDQFRTGMQQNIPVSAPFTIAKYFTFTPSADYTETWALQTVRKSWNADSSRIEEDTVHGFASTREYSFSVGTQTRLYGFYTFNHGKVQAIRHVINPSVSFQYRPDFSLPNYNTYHDVQYDSLGNTEKYSIFENSVYTGPPQGKFGGINFSIGNTLDMKVLSKKDTISGTKKIKLLDALNISSAYNFAVDSLNLSPFNINGRTTLFDKLSINFSSSFDPYISDSTGRRLNTLEWNANNRLARLTNASIGAQMNLQSKNGKSLSAGSTSAAQQQQMYSGNDYIDFNVPWHLGIGYSLFIQKENTLNGADTTVFTQTLKLDGSFNLTHNWSITGSTSYDFINKKFATAFLDIYRDLHCWELHLQWIPFGVRQSYSIDIRVKSTLLQDLKIHKAKDWYDY